MKMNRHKYYNDPAFFSKVIARIYNNVMVRQNFLRLFSYFFPFPLFCHHCYFVFLEWRKWSISWLITVSENGPQKG